MTAEDVASAMKTAEYCMGSMQVEHQAFILACRYGKWQEAEEHRLKAVTALEAQMDAFALASRGMEDDIG